MAKSGPARRAGVRYPSGKLKTPEKQGMLAPAEIRRVVDAARRKAADPLLATSVGWMRLHGDLTDLETAAAVRYAALRGAHSRLKGYPARSAASPSYQIGYGSVGGPEDEMKVLRVSRDHARMIFLVADDRDLLDRVCIDDQVLCGFEKRRFGNALARLVSHFRLTA